MTWNNGSNAIVIPSTQKGDVVNIPIGTVTGGKPSYTLALVPGSGTKTDDPPLSEFGPFYIHSKEDGEQNANDFAIVGTGDGIPRGSWSA